MNAGAPRRAPGSGANSGDRSRYHRPIGVESVSTLRGASVAIDHRRAGRLALAVCVAALAVSAGVLYAAGANKNAQITSLRDHGVPVEVTVTGCLGQLGGSGSNAAGYSCTGTFVLGGRRHSVVLPDGALHSPGDKVKEITVASDPGLVSSPGQVAASAASWRVFVLPTILLLAGALIAGGWLVRTGRTDRST